jgi:hypothetical protein
MAWPKLKNRSSAQLMTASNHSGAAHNGAQSQEKAPEGAPGGQVRLPFLRAQGARRTEGAGGVQGPEGPEGPEPVRDAPVTWPRQAADEAVTAEGTAADVAEAADPEPAAAEPETAAMPLWAWSQPEARSAEGHSAEVPPAGELEAAVSARIRPSPSGSPWSPRWRRPMLAPAGSGGA